jgi:hypothetical protein
LARTIKGEPPSGENPIFPIASIYIQFREKLTSAVVRQNGCTDIRPYGEWRYTVAPGGLYVAAGSDTYPGLYLVEGMLEVEVQPAGLSNHMVGGS